MSDVDDKTKFSRRAQEILGDPILLHLIEAQQADIVREWMQTPLDATEEREQLFHRARATKTLLDELRSVANDEAVRKFNARKVSV